MGQVVPLDDRSRDHHTPGMPPSAERSVPLTPKSHRAGLARSVAVRTWAATPILGADGSHQGTPALVRWRWPTRAVGAPGFVLANGELGMWGRGRGSGVDPGFSREGLLGVEGVERSDGGGGNWEALPGPMIGESVGAAALAVRSRECAVCREAVGGGRSTGRAVGQHNLRWGKGGWSVHARVGSGGSVSRLFRPGRSPGFLDRPYLGFALARRQGVWCMVADGRGAPATEGRWPTR